MTAFSIGGSVGVIDQAGLTVAVSVPAGTDTSALVATFEHTGAKVQVANRNQTSGETANDFSSPKNYKVIAENGESKTYAVTVEVEPE